MTKFKDLWPGDRFESMDETIWTKVGMQLARLHSEHSMALGTQGYGYCVDAIATFSPDEEVIFKPVRKIV